MKMEINIGGSIDPFYRYKRSSVILKIQSTKGGETIIENSKTIADELYRTVIEIAKYLQYELNTTQSIKENKIVLRGIFTKLKIEECIEKLCSEFIICPTCKIPETFYEKSKKNLYMKCKGCGYSTKLEESKYSKFLSTEISKSS